jgi:hypothetical protein
LFYKGRNDQPVALCIALTETDATSALRFYNDSGVSYYGRGEDKRVFVVVGPSKNPALRTIADAMPGLFKPS